MKMVRISCWNISKSIKQVGCLIISIILLNLRLLSQADTLAVIVPEFPKLNKSKNPYPKYVNFDVIKLMPSLSWSPELNHPRATINWQFLCPYALFKDKFPIAIGVGLGKSIIYCPNKKYEISNGTVVNLMQDYSIEYSKQQSNYVALMLLHVLRCRSFTFLIGPSLNYNYKNRLTESTVDGKFTRIDDESSVYKFTTPLHLQMSFSPLQLISFGAFVSYEIQPRFKSDQLKSIHQMTAGVSIALII